jgi:molecular chaperone GrpE
MTTPTTNSTQEQSPSELKTAPLPEEAQAEDRAEQNENQETEAPADSKATEEIVQLNNQLLRLAADFENFRKRSRREQDEQRKYGVEPVIRALLPVKDNLDRALEHSTGDDPLTDGVKMVSKLFDDVMASFGVSAFDSQGEHFDPVKHEAMSQIPSEDTSPGSVVQELEKGYTLHDRLLRPAKVIVAA